MSEIRSHRDLIAWQKAIELCTRIYSLTGTFPAAEKFGLVSQMRRVAVSVPSNIAEGNGRGTTSDYVRFLRNARGSMYEIDTQLLIAGRLGYVPEPLLKEVEGQMNECSRILVGLIRSLEERNSPDHRGLH